MNSKPDERTLSPRQFRLLAFAGHGTNDIYWFILPIMLPMMLTQYKLQYGGGGAVLSIYLMVVALSSVVAGRLSDRVHRWRLIGIGFLLAAAGFAASALSTPLPLFVASLAVAAVGVGVFHPAMYGTIDATITSGKASFYGAFESWGVLTLAVMIILVGTLLRTVEWRGVLLIVALPGLVAAVVFLMVRRPPAQSDIEAADEPPTGPSTLLLAAFLTSNMLRFFTIAGVLSFIPTYFVHQVDLAPESAAYAGALVFAGGVVGARLGGYLGERLSPIRIMLILVAAVGPLVFLFGSLSSVVVMGIALFALGIAAMGCIPLQNILLRDFGPHLGGGQVFGIMMGLMTVTQALSPAALGGLADTIGLASAIRMFSLPAIASWAILFAVGRSRFARGGTRRKANSPEQTIP